MPRPLPFAEKTASRLGLTSCSSPAYKTYSSPKKSMITLPRMTIQSIVKACHVFEQKRAAGFKSRLHASLRKMLKHTAGKAFGQLARAKVSFAFQQIANGICKLLLLGGIYKPHKRTHFSLTRSTTAWQTGHTSTMA